MNGTPRLRAERLVIQRAKTFDKDWPLAFHRAQMKMPFLVAALLLGTLQIAWSEAPQPAQTTVASTDSDFYAFARGTKEFQNVTGAFFFFDRGGNDRPSIDYAVTSFRLGYMLSNPHGGQNFYAGNFELLGEAFGGGIFEGPGNVLAGATLLFRYNFVQPQARLIPYLGLGGGGVYTDIGTKASQGLISLPVEFNLQGTAGFRYMLDKQWSLVLEATYRHVSNATIKLPNYGLDNLGGDLGVGFSF